MSKPLNPIAFDIETTGLTASDTITVVGFAMPLGVRVFLNLGGRERRADDLEPALETDMDHRIDLSLHQDEPTLLEALARYVHESIAPREVFLTAYNGERWRSGFDLPCLRTRFHAHDANWPFGNVPYADLMPLFERRFLTRQDREQTSFDLESVSETVLGGRLTSLDPFADSESAVAAFEDGEFAALLRHNCADVLRTARLARVAQRYCSRSDFEFKSLTPPVGTYPP